MARVEKTSQVVGRMEGRGNPHALWWEWDLVPPVWKTVEIPPQIKKKTEMPYDPVIPLPGIYPKKTKLLI